MELKMEEKRYLKWYNKVGYGSGDIAGNVVYALLSAFARSCAVSEMIWVRNAV